MFRTIMRPGGASDSDREGAIVEDRGGVLYEYGDKVKEEDPGIDMAGEEVTLDSDDMAGDEPAVGDDSAVHEATLDSEDMEGDEQAVSDSRAVVEATLDSDDMGGDEQATAVGGTGVVEDTLDDLGDDDGLEGEPAIVGDSGNRDHGDGPTLTNSERGESTSSEVSSGEDGGASTVPPGLVVSSEGDLEEDDGRSSTSGAGEQRQR